MSEVALYISILVNVYLIVRLEKEKFKTRVYKDGFESSIELWNINKKEKEQSDV